MKLTVALDVSTMQTRKDCSLNLGNAACHVPSTADFTAVNSVCCVSYTLTRDCNICKGTFSLDHLYFIKIVEEIWDKMKRRGRNIFHLTL
jgi:hypothetical protein